MNFSEFGSSWIWHPHWVDSRPDAAGSFVHFKKTLLLDRVPDHAIEVNITADTRYKLYINHQLVFLGPVKGDEHRWFYDTVDIQPFLREGSNNIAVHVMRFFHATTFATSFARMPIPGLYIRTLDKHSPVTIDSDATWQTALDPSAHLRIDEPYDLFLHVFEEVDRRKDGKLSWVPAKIIEIEEDWGVTLPWKLCQRLIPPLTREPVQLKAVHNIRSTLKAEQWEQILHPSSLSKGVTLPAGSSHHIELEAAHHLTALLAFRFRPQSSSRGSLRITYAECYEDEPATIPFLRRKKNRCDTSKSIFGPSDLYFVGGSDAISLGHHSTELEQQEVYQPFHFRTFRYMVLDFQVGPDADLVFDGIEVLKTNYPLEKKASFSTGDESISKLWSISVRTLENCMHDCYEDCPFYEQMQYPMDTRSSSLFTYLVSGDDKLARQAILQLYDSFEPSVGLTHSRSTSGNMQRQFIPPFSLYWICMVTDHYEYFADATFSRRFIGVCDAILETFSSWIDSSVGLVRAFNNATWEYADWTRFWAPQGIQPAIRRTGFSTYINCLYAYTLRAMASLLKQLGRPGLAVEYLDRATNIVTAVREYCFDGEYFTDGLATSPVPSREYSQHCQVWAVLCGAASGDLATRILDHAMDRGNVLSQTSYTLNPHGPGDSFTDEPVPDSGRTFTMASISFSFYTIRALAAAGDEIYERHFHSFWSLWRDQIRENLTTWAEDAVCVRSDCHAWGSIPIYEFITEVAGIKPASPGWSKVLFKPRLALFPQLKATVPINIGRLPAFIEVQWAEKKTASSKSVEITLRLKGEKGGLAGPVPVIVALPGGNKNTIIELDTSATFEVSEEQSR